MRMGMEGNPRTELHCPQRFCLSFELLREWKMLQLFFNTRRGLEREQVPPATRIPNQSHNLRCHPSVGAHSQPLAAPWRECLGQVLRVDSRIEPWKMGAEGGGSGGGGLLSPSSPPPSLPHSRHEKRGVCSFTLLFSSLFLLLSKTSLPFWCTRRYVLSPIFRVFRVVFPASPS